MLQCCASASEFRMLCLHFPVCVLGKHVGRLCKVAPGLLVTPAKSAFSAISTCVYICQVVQRSQGQPRWFAVIVISQEKDNHEPQSCRSASENPVFCSRIDYRYHHRWPKGPSFWIVWELLSFSGIHSWHHHIPSARTPMAWMVIHRASSQNFGLDLGGSAEPTAMSRWTSQQLG